MYSSWQLPLHWIIWLIPASELVLSLTLYDAKTTSSYLNPLEGYRISDRAEGIKLNDDGSLTVTIRHGEPEDKSNWLPAKVSPFLQTLRIYWPEQDTIEGKWTPSPVKRIGWYSNYKVTTKVLPETGVSAKR